MRDGIPGKLKLIVEFQFNLEVRDEEIFIYHFDDSDVIVSFYRMRFHFGPGVGASNKRRYDQREGHFARSEL
ncbi:MAG: hypothetical protein HBSAPP04_00590 [Ignavibacteriaceae bacterium]|nr:MAG: hypothetical protein HBSAPP04_00590 [Ignavibacteriaceae bacterium]